MARRYVVRETTEAKKAPRKALHWTLIFLVVALIAALFGFGGIAGTAAWIAKALFVLFLILFVVSFFIEISKRATYVPTRKL